MTREIFLNTLFAHLPQCTEEAKEEIRTYYEELICDGIEAGLSEDEVISKLDTPENIARSLSAEYTSKQPVHNVILSARDRGFYLSVSEDDQVHVYCEQDEMDEIVCYEKDGTFFFAQNNKKNIHFFFHFGNRRITSVINVKLPKSVLQTEVTTTNASIRVMDGLKLNELSARTKNSGISCQSIACGQMELITENSSIKCSQVQADVLQMATSNSSIKLNDVVVQNKLHAKTSNGSIQFENISAQRITLETTNASIKGTLPGCAADYSIVSHTSNGKNTLPTEFNTENSEAKQLSVYTSNAGIKVFFEK